MSTTTNYGSWASHGTGVVSISDTVTDFVNGGGQDWLDTLVETGAFDRIVDDVRAAINANLPGGVTLNGDEFYGPYPLPGGVRPHHLNTLIPEVIESVDLGAIIERHDPDNQTAQ